MSEIRRHAGHVAFPEYRGSEHISGHRTDTDACNAMLALADQALAAGNTIDGAGYVLYITTPHQQLSTYRVWDRRNG